MGADTDWDAVADSAYREFVEDERREKDQQHLEELEAEVGRLRAEVEKYRKDARRWRFIAAAPGSVTLRIHNTRADGRDEAIDAAMGASA